MFATNSFRLRWFAFALLAIAASCAAATSLADDMTFPGAQWEEASPHSQSLDAKKLAVAVDYLKQHAGRDGVRELVIVRNGRMVWKGEDIDKVHGIWSCTKSFTSTTLGLLIEDGKCTLDTPAKKFVPELAEHFPDVTLRHFTTMTSGYRAVGDEPKGSYLHGPSSTPFQPFDKPLFSPGSKYAYWDSAMNMFGLVLTRAAGEPLETLFKRRIADPIGMNSKAWDWGAFATVDGIVVNGGSGNSGKHITISAREMARLGHLFLNRGNWNGKQLISAAWIDAATSVQVPAETPLGHPESNIDGRGVYGFNWWTNGVRPDGERLWPAAPTSAFAALGHNNNKLCVIPDWNMVIVRLGLDQNDVKISDAVWSEFVRLLDASRTDGDVADDSAQETGVSFRVHEIARPGGRSFGQTSAVDVDNDGDLDFISGRQSGDVFWFENPLVKKGSDPKNRNGPEGALHFWGLTPFSQAWSQHLIGEKAKTDVGGVAFDVDGDGWVDQVSGGTWFRNPGNPREAARWERFENGTTPTHDNLAADIDGDGKLDLVSILDKAGVFWYGIPQDPTKHWIEHKLLGVTKPQCHGGIAVGDIDGDGDLDVSRLDRWLENADGKGEAWIERKTFDFGKEGPWGIQTRAVLVDVDRDGDLDLVQAEGDVLDGRVAWFENLHGNGKDWERHMIKEPGHNQDFHSICVADFDNDGDVDIFSGGGPLTVGEHVWFLWENTDGKGGDWKEHVVQRGQRTHESVCGDIDGDGDIDIFTKPWRGDLHLFVENLLAMPNKVKHPR
jgi:CubicO group peptidase (beta-lactamase class C family)